MSKENFEQLVKSLPLVETSTVPIEEDELGLSAVYEALRAINPILYANINRTISNAYNEIIDNDGFTYDNGVHLVLTRNQLRGVIAFSARRGALSALLQVAKPLDDSRLMDEDYGS